MSRSHVHGEIDGEEKNKHKEEGEGRQRRDEADWKKIAMDAVGEVQSSPQ